MPWTGFAMRENVTLACLGALFTVGIVCLATFVKTAPHPPPDISIPMLLADPDYYLDREIRVKIAGAERNGSDIVYRTHTNRPPAIVFRMSEPFGDIPPFIRGICRGKQGEFVLVDVCHPE